MTLLCTVSIMVFFHFFCVLTKPLHLLIQLPGVVGPTVLTHLHFHCHLNFYQRVVFCNFRVPLSLHAYILWEVLKHFVTMYVVTCTAALFANGFKNKMYNSYHENSLFWKRILNSLYLALWLVSDVICSRLGCKIKSMQAKFRYNYVLLCVHKLLPYQQTVLYCALRCGLFKIETLRRWLFCAPIDSATSVPLVGDSVSMFLYSCFLT